MIPLIHIIVQCYDAKILNISMQMNFLFEQNFKYTLKL